MLPKANRLSKNKDISRVFKEGKLVRNDCLSLKFFKNQLTVSRFAFVVSLKVSKKAHLRNKIKRQLRESVRLRLRFIKAGFDAILKAEPGIKNNQNLSENFFFGSRPAPRYFLFFWLPILSDLFRVRLSGDREARFKKRRGKKYFENFKMQPFLQRRDRPCWQLI